MTVFRAATLRTFFFAIFAGAKELNLVVDAVMAASCFTITEMSYLVIGLFHDVLQHLRSNICDISFFCWTCEPRSKISAKGLYLSGGSKGM